MWFGSDAITTDELMLPDTNSYKVSMRFIYDKHLEKKLSELQRCKIVHGDSFSHVCFGPIQKGFYQQISRGGFSGIGVSKIGAERPISINRYKKPGQAIVLLMTRWRRRIQQRILRQGGL